MKPFKWLVILLTLCCLLSFVACASPNKDLVGRWEITIEDEELGSIDMVYHFTEDGLINLEQKDGDQIPFSIPFGSFSVEKETLTIFSDGETSVYAFFVTNGTLTLSAKGEEDLVFKRV